MSETVPGEPLIVFQKVSLGFDTGDVLREISFEVYPGETLVLLGESGAGKTLLMKLAAGLLQPDSGTITVMGHKVSDMPEEELLDFRRDLGFVFQEGALFDSLSVADNVGYRLQEEAMDPAEVEKRVREVLRFVELEQAIEKYPAELSGGMRRRVSIARALIGRPQVVFYDSPTAGLDPVTSQTILTLILRGRDLQDATSLIATQRVQDAFGVARFRYDKTTGRVFPLNGGAALAPARKGIPATKILVLKDGKVYFEGAADEVLRSSDDYLKKFLASAE
ncbi:MAG TPA: ATP-binding cassette domain-containing protein [Candidatus Acidoferrales bacterium]|jgi:phospholipid/cholesterol/gamma-HCH transport system ATP-binding protein|nr:ATP-binding cassette domain-containing protein [Candidatus Acidoferrales bacterium]HYL82999.1 ATP-binding cassette domain-containing protein [Candidatus Angelobacter sp.]